MSTKANVTVEKFNNKPLFIITNSKGERVTQFTATLVKKNGNVGSIFTAIVAAMVYGESVDIEKRLFQVDKASIVGDNGIANILRKYEGPLLTSQFVLFLEELGVRFFDDENNRFSPNKTVSKTTYAVRNIKVAQKVKVEG